MSVLDHISREELRQLQERSNLRAAWMTLANFALVAVGFALPVVWGGGPGWIAGALVLGGRSLGLGILVHDAAHQTLFTSKRLNEWAGKWLFGGLPNVPYAAYREGHLRHHRAAGTPDDPDLAFVDGYPASRASLARKLLRDVSGVTGAKNIAYQAASFRLDKQRPFLLAHAALIGLLLCLHHVEAYACWWLAQLFVLPLLMRLRVMGEHGGVDDHFDADPRANTATTLAGPLARLLCAPNHVNFHLEHHFAPGVPSYRLREMHRRLAARGCYDGWHCVAASYLQVVRRCLRSTAAAVEPRPVRARAKGALSRMQ